MTPNPTLPLIVNSDFSVLLEVKTAAFKEARQEIAAFLELVKSPEIFHTYKLTQISLWNGFSTGLEKKQIIATLEKYAKFPLPGIVREFIEKQAAVFGLIALEKHDENTYKLTSRDTSLLASICKNKEIKKIIYYDAQYGLYLVPHALRGIIKLEIVKLGFPVDDKVGYIDGDHFPFTLDSTTFEPRPYQKESVDIFFGNNNFQRGAGIIVLPCGAGKTLTGIMIMTRLQMKTLIVTPNIVSLRQWKSELLEHTDIDPDSVGEYSGEEKQLRPITIATYQILTYRLNRESDFEHMSLFSTFNWGLIIYDEVHLLPAPVFRTIAGIQARRRLGLTATLVREDGREKDVFALIGPKKYDISWKELEKDRYIANAICWEIRADMPERLLGMYYKSNDRDKFRMAAENPEKLDVINSLLDNLKGHRILIIGQFLNQLYSIREKFGAPIITGKTPNMERVTLYNQFKSGELDVLIVSKVANFAIDLPDADVAIQVSGIYGSRQEEAQRLGRIIRPKKGHNHAYFFTVVSNHTNELDYAQNRKRFLIEQGYEYKMLRQQDLKENNFSLHECI